MTVPSRPQTPAKSTTEKPLRCCRLITGKPCARKVAWYVRKIGAMCNFHYDQLLTDHTDIDVDQVVRLSEDDRDFFEPHGRWNGLTGALRPAGK